MRQQRILPKCAPSKAIPPSKLTTLASGTWMDHVPVSGAISTDGQQVLTGALAADAFGNGSGESTIGRRAPTRTSATPAMPRATIQRRPCWRIPRRSANAATGSTSTAIPAWEAGCDQTPPSAGASTRRTGAAIQCAAQAIATTIPRWSKRRKLGFWSVIRLFSRLFSRLFVKGQVPEPAPEFQTIMDLSNSKVEANLDRHAVNRGQVYISTSARQAVSHF